MGKPLPTLGALWVACSAEFAPSSSPPEAEDGGKSHRWSAHGMDRLLFFRERLGFEPRSVLDLGAHVGDWTRAALGVFPEAAFFLVEADPRHAAALAGTGQPFEIALLASSPNATATFHSTRFFITTGASLFPERTAFYSDPRLARPVVLPTRTLDDVVVGRLGADCCDFLKADVQGAEIEVLRGGSRTLRNAKLVQLEAPILPYNQGAPHFSELVAFMAAAGFEVVDIADAMHCEDVERVLHFDVLFAPRGSPFLEFPFRGGIRGQRA